MMFPDMQQAAYGDASVIAAIVEAFQERQAAAREYAGSPLFEEAFYSLPTIQQLTVIRWELAEMARYYYDMSSPLYPYDSWGSFPRRFSRDDVLAGLEDPVTHDRVHALARLPLPYDAVSDEAALKLFRDFCTEVVWWLEELRVPVSSAYARWQKRLDASGRWNKYYQDDGSEDFEDGDRFHGGAEVTVRTGNYSSPVTCTASRELIKEYGGEIVQQYEDEEDPWKVTGADYRRTRSSEIDIWRLRQYRDLFIANKSVIPAEAYLIPCYSALAYEKREEYTEITNTDFAKDDDGFISEIVAQSGEERRKTVILSLDEEFPTEETVTQYSSPIRDVATVWHREYTRSTWEYSPNFLHVHDEQTTEEDENYAYSVTTSPNTYVIESLFDGLSRFALGQPYFLRELHPHESATFFPEESLDVPVLWDRGIGIDSNPAGGPTYGDSATHRLSLATRLVPVLDHNIGFKYQSSRALMAPRQS